MRARVLLSIFLAILLVMSFAVACAEEEPEPEPEKPIIGYSPLSDPFDALRKSLDDGVRYAITEGGGAMMYCSPSPAGGTVGDPAVQAACVDTFIAAGVDAMIIWACDPAAIVSSVQKANDAGIPFFLFYSNLPKGSGVDVVLSGAADVYPGAIESGEATLDALIDRYGEPKGLVLNIQGDMEGTHGIQRSQGLHEVLDPYPDITIIDKEANWDMAQARTILEDHLTAHPETDVIHFATMTYLPACIDYLESIGKWNKIGEPDHMIITGNDDTALALYCVRCGWIEECYAHATNFNALLMGRVVMEYLNTGVAPQEGDRIYSGIETFPYADVVHEPQADELLMMLSGFPVTDAETAALPDLFGNMLEDPPNGLEPECGTSELPWDR